MPDDCEPMGLPQQCNAGPFFGLEDCHRRRVCQSITTCHLWMAPAARGSGGGQRGSRAIVTHLPIIAIIIVVALDYRRRQLV